jgi:hypothetical protein
MALAQLAVDYADDSLERIKAVQDAANIRGIAYQDMYSADKCSHTDLKLGHENGLVGCNGTLSLGASTTKKGDIVVIKANKGKRRYMSIGILETRLSSCDLWYKNGGHRWKYNYTYKPITKIFKITPELIQKVEALGAKHNCNAKNFFNARFCSVKLKPILLDLILEDVI